MGITTAAFIRKAETEYSRLRRSALEYEWRSAFPQLPLMLSFLATKGKSLIEFSELDDKDKAEELAYEICSKQQKDYDPIYESAAATFDGKTGSTKFLKDVISILYRVGAIGVKLRPGGAFMYSHRDD